MKYAISIFLFAFVLSVRANDYYEPRINEYDPSSGLYFKAVVDSVEERGFLSSKESSNNVVNVNIFDPATGQSVLLFKDAQKDGISVIAFEAGFKDGSIEFNGSTYESIALNNSHIKQRNVKDQLLVGVRNNAAKETVLLVSDKRGHSLKKIASVPFGASWHIDVKNSKLRVIRQIGNAIKIESYEW